MTKAELIQFLKSYNDDIKILIYVNESGQLWDFEPEYKTADGKKQRWANNVFLKKDEGYLEIFG